MGQAIVMYRSWQRIIDTRKSPTKTRDDLYRLYKNAQALMEGLIRAMGHPDAHVALTVPIRPPKGWPRNTGPVDQDVAHQRLVCALHEIDRLTIWLGLARDRVQSRKRGAHRQSVPAYFLVNGLNQILEGFTGRKIERSAKRPDAAEPDTVQCVKAVCRIADPDIGNGTIMEAMKKEIHYYKPYGEIILDRTTVIPPRKIRCDRRPSAAKSGKRAQKER